MKYNNICNEFTLNGIFKILFLIIINLYIIIIFFYIKKLFNEIEKI